MVTAYLPDAVLGIAAFAASCLGVRMLIGYLTKKAILDHPVGRSSHSTPTPRGGGLAVSATVLGAWIVIHLMMPVAGTVFLIGAAVFSLVFRGFGGEELIQHFFLDMPGGVVGATLVVMLVIFLLGFILDFIEITFVVVPIVGPILLAMGVDPIWLGIMIALNLQTSFLTPPFGFALFYLRGVAPDSLPTSAIYRGVIPFIIIQLIAMAALWYWPEMATGLPALLKN